MKKLSLSPFTSAAIMVCQNMATEIIMGLSKKCQCHQDRDESLPIARAIKDQLALLNEAVTKKAALSSANVCIILARTIGENLGTGPCCVIDVVMGQVFDELND